MIYQEGMAYNHTKETLNAILGDVPTNSYVTLYMIDNEPLASYLSEVEEDDVFCINSCELFKDCHFKNTKKIHNYITYKDFPIAVLDDTKLFMFDESILRNEDVLKEIIDRLQVNARIIYYQVSDEVEDKELKDITIICPSLKKSTTFIQDSSIENPTIAEYLHHKLMVHAEDSRLISIIGFVKQYCTSESPKVIKKATYQVYSKI